MRSASEIREAGWRATSPSAETKWPVKSRSRVGLAKSLSDAPIHPLPRVRRLGDGMRASVGMLLATILVVGSGCAKQDWIDRTLVTVDVTGTWSGTMMTAGSGGAGGARDVVFELEQKGSMVKGTMRVTSRGQAADTREGTVAGDVFRFKDPRATWEGELTISGEEMAGRVMTGSLSGQLTLR